MTITRYRCRTPSYIRTARAGQYNVIGMVIPVDATVSGNIKSQYGECWDELHPGPPYRSGGPLFVKRLEQSCPWSQAVSLTKGAYNYVGRFRHSPINLDLDYQGMDLKASDDGAKAWNKFRPVKPRASMGQFIAELRDFPKMFAFRLKGFQDLGGQYLNYKFGWAPFLRDVQKFMEAQKKIERYIAFTRKNNGKWIQRGGTVDREITSTTAVYSCMVTPGLLTTFYKVLPNLSPTTCVINEVEHVWFKARMKFYIPDLAVDSAKDIWTSALRRKIYGLEITPALLWELTPWSWLVDWVGNIGDILSNITNFYYDNLVAKYAYIMRSWSRSRFFTTNMIYQTSSDNVPVPVRVVSYDVVESKERAEASPYGFSVDWPDFSTYQLGILAALGVSKIRPGQY